VQGRGLNLKDACGRKGEGIREKGCEEEKKNKKLSTLQKVRTLEMPTNAHVDAGGGH